MVRRRRGCAIVLLFLLFGLLQHGSAQVPSCTVTQRDGQTIYTIVPLISAVKAFDYEYTWANASQHVMAHNHAKAPELVMTNSINTLVTSRCIDKVVYARTCISKGEHHTVDCMTSCPESAVGDKDLPPSSIAWIIIVVAVVVVVVMGLLVCLCYKLKNRAPSSDKSSLECQVGLMDGDPKAADVESKRAGGCFC